TRAAWSKARRTRPDAASGPTRHRHDTCRGHRAMKYFHLIWAALFRRKTRTFLTLASILAAFLLFGMLDGIRSTFAQLGQNADGAQRLQTTSRLSMVETLPLSLESRIRQLDNIEAVTWANWFGGAYQNPRNQLFTFAVAPNYLELYPE